MCIAILALNDYSVLASMVVIEDNYERYAEV